MHTGLLTLTGILSGVGFGLLLGLQPTAAIPLAAPVALADDREAMQDLVIHWTAADFAVPAVTGLIQQLDQDCGILLLCPDGAAAEDASNRFGTRVTTVTVDHPLTGWSRDRWHSLRSPSGTTLLTPRQEAGAMNWPARAGDGRAAAAIANHDPSIATMPSTLLLEGGDVVCSSDHAFVAGRALTANRHADLRSVSDLEVELFAQLGKPAIVLTQAPDHHAGMLMMTAGERQVIVGDPRLARNWLTDHNPNQTNGADCDEDMARRFDAITRQCQDAGYTVLRVPVVPERQGRAWLTWCNGILDQRGDQRFAYLPSYPQTAPELEAKAYAVWRQAGWTVVPIDCEACWRHGGTLRCLVSVLRREPSGSEG